MKNRNRIVNALNDDTQMEELLREATKMTIEKPTDRSWQEHNEAANVWTNGTMEEDYNRN